METGGKDKKIYLRWVFDNKRFFHVFESEVISLHKDSSRSSLIHTFEGDKDRRLFLYSSLKDFDSANRSNLRQELFDFRLKRGEEGESVNHKSLVRANQMYRL